MHLIARQRVVADATAADATEADADVWPPRPALEVLGGTPAQQAAANGAGFRFDILRGGDPDAADTVYVQPEWRPASGGDSSVTSRTPSVPPSALATPRGGPSRTAQAPAVTATPRTRDEDNDDGVWGSPLGAVPRHRGSANRHWP
uniref:Uncharacterized protein n=1 Tax=Neobodo designis TaxID=312471 RepID=A0A7S1LJK9_NEODS